MTSASTELPKWAQPMMRVGFGARGVVFVIVGGIALTAALLGVSAPGTRGALARMIDEPFGQVLLALVAVGLLAYAGFRFLAAGMDLEARGSSAKGRAARIGMAVSGVIHCALAGYAASLTLGSNSGSASRGAGNGGGGSSQEGLTADLMAQPFGPWLVAAVGLITIGVAVHFGLKAKRESYKRLMVRTPRSERLDPLIKFGLVAHGVVIAIIGGFFIWAAWTVDPSKAGGIGQAFEVIRSSPFGQLLLGVVAAGLIAFAIYCFVQARYRIVPQVSGGDTMTLAGRPVASILR